MHSNAFIHQIFSTLYYHVKVLTISDLVSGTALLKLYRCTCTPIQSCYCILTLASHEGFIFVFIYLLIYFTH